MDAEFYRWFVARLKVANNKGGKPPELLLQLRYDSHDAATQLATQLEDLGG